MAVCRECQKETAISNLPYCTSCLMELYNKYRGVGDNTKHLAIWCLCAELNIAYIKNIATRSSDIVSYIKNLYMSSDARSFEDTDTHLFDVFRYGKLTKQINDTVDTRLQENIEENQEASAELHEQIVALKDRNKYLEERIQFFQAQEEQLEEKKKEIDMEKAIMTWGDDYTEEEYRLLDDIFNMYTYEIDNLTPAAKFRYQDVAKLELRRRQLGNNADPKESKIIADELKSLYAMLDIGNFESNQKSEEEKFIDKLIWTVENTRPAEVEDLNEYKDFSNFQDAWEEINRCLYNAVAGTKEFPTLGRVEQDE